VIYHTAVMCKPAPDLGGEQGAPHHVHMFSHMCDMCVPLNLFYRGKFVCRRY